MRIATKVIVVLTLCAVASAQSIGHVVYIIMENRSHDQIFGSFPGVAGSCFSNTWPYAYTGSSCTIGNNTCGSGNQCTNSLFVTNDPASCSLTSCYTLNKQYVTTSNPQGQEGNLAATSLSHAHVNAIAEINGGLMNGTGGSGWAIGGNCATGAASCNYNISTACSSGANGPCLSNEHYYVDSNALPFLYQMATTFGIADEFFSTQAGPSYPGHFYIWAATSGINGYNASDNPSGGGSIWGCNQTGTSGTKPTWNNTATYNQLTYTSTNYTVCLAGDPNCGPSGDGLAAGTGMMGGKCSSSSTTACSCFCASGTYVNGSGSSNCTTWASTSGGGSVSSSCSDTTDCGSSTPTCSTSSVLGDTPGGPCPYVTTPADVLEAASVTWKYYNTNALWDAAPYTPQIAFRNGTGGKNALSYYNPADSQFVTDVGNTAGQCVNSPHSSCTLDSQCSSQGSKCVDTSSSALPAVAFLSPNAATNTMHGSEGLATPLADVQYGQTWINTQLNAIFANAYLYNHVAVFITWDDWGGIVDHVAPPTSGTGVTTDALTLGPRVPLMCIGPYCRNQVTHTVFEFASVLKCIEDLFSTGAINARVTNATDICAGSGTLTSNTNGMINLSQTPIPDPGGNLTTPTGLSNGVKISGGVVTQ